MQDPKTWWNKAIPDWWQTAENMPKSFPKQAKNKPELQAFVSQLHSRGECLNTESKFMYAAKSKTSDYNSDFCHMWLISHFWHTNP